jgi:hypothetical protein
LNWEISEPVKLFDRLENNSASPKASSRPESSILSRQWLSVNLSFVQSWKGGPLSAAPAKLETARAFMVFWRQIFNIVASL